MNILVMLLINFIAIGAVFAISIANMTYGWGLTPASWPAIIGCFCGTVGVTTLNTLAVALLKEMG